MRRPRHHPEFDWSGRALRDEGSTRVLSHAPDYWKLDAWQALWFLMETGQDYDAEDLRALVGDPPNNPNTMGAVFLHMNIRLVKAGLVEVVGLRRASRPSSHRCILQVYRGIKQPDPADDKPQGIDFPSEL